MALSHGSRRRAWSYRGRVVMAEVDDPRLLEAAEGFYPDLRCEPPDRTAPHLRLRGSEGEGYRVERSAGKPRSGGKEPPSSRHDSPSQALSAFEVALSEILLGHLDGVILLHAGGVTGKDGALLLVGRGGAGKSTLAACLARLGHPVLGDDVLPLERGSGRVLPFPRLLKLEPAGAGMLGLPFPHGPGAQFREGASLVHPAELGSRWAEPSRTGSVLFPTFQSDGPRRADRILLEPVPPAQALRGLLDHRLFPEPDPGRDFSDLAELVDGLRLCARMAFGDSGEAARRLHDEILEG